MNNMDNISKKIEKLRQSLLDIMLIKEDLIDPEVVRASILLDMALNEYNSKIFHEQPQIH